jgi:hypothetical protein
MKALCDENMRCSTLQEYKRHYRCNIVFMDTQLHERALFR